MNKYVYYLILCGTLLLHCCGERNTKPEGNKPTNGSTIISSSTLPIENNLINNSNMTQIGTKTNTNRTTTLTADDEEEKFNTFKSGLDIILKHMENELKDHKANIKPLSEYHVEEYENTLSQYPGFIEWLSNNPQKQKELANAFTYFYDFLNDQRIKQSSTLTNQQLLINTLNCNLKAYQKSNAQCNDNNYAYNNNSVQNLKDKIYSVFLQLLKEINTKNTNEERLDAIIQDILLKPDSVIARLIGTDRLEAMIKREKLNDNQEKGLDFLKKAFINLVNADYMLYTFLLFSENEIKEALDHIYSELEKCNGNNKKQDTFKSAIRNYFNIISSKKLYDFKYKVTSGC
ncbi:Mlp family lipoprotein (plasmid) [Borrelia miyamotoi]|uniref:Mlp family lipoprotein n=1 Tax=Borrelia miyamotoi TaxID=47466 RepID=A0A5P8AUT9_9SPIR|nr:Mlp family lipoprotein [Borrelia miyamotoi]QFP42632.1 Mlp family lipoprotein [Borrelia miyamotoi]WAZ72524.1 Mlp family lipoprotein [Borrelia miyamotoi]